MRLKHLLAGTLAAALLAGPVEAASPSQPSYIVRLPLANSYGSNDTVIGSLGMWFDPACNTLGAGLGCPRPASTDFPMPTAPAAGSNASPFSSFSYIAAATANDTAITTNSVTVYSVVACNNVASMRFVRLFNQAATPNGTTTPAWRGSLPSNGGCVTLFNSPNGVAFPAGLGFDITTGVPDADQTATTANDVFLNVGYR